MLDDRDMTQLLAGYERQCNVKSKDTIQNNSFRLLTKKLITPVLLLQAMVTAVTVP